jgi:SAM-dependent methyltransferase
MTRGSVILEAQTGPRLLDGGVAFGTMGQDPRRRELRFTVHPSPWRPSTDAELTVKVEPDGEGSRLRLEVAGWSDVLRANHAALPDWSVERLVPRLLELLSPTVFGDWIVEHQARRPSGADSSASYRDPTYHWPNFLMILDRLRLTPADRLLEVACGGGAFLSKALASGCTAVGLDHSPEMLRTARELNAEAIRAGRLTVVEGDAARLPVPSDAFTVCVCTGAFFFFADPAAALGEMRRALCPGGRLAVFTETPEARGTIAAPEPFASRARLHTPGELRTLAEGAGFVEIRVEEPDLAPFARAAHLPSDVVAVFERTGGSVLLTARKPAG